MSPPVREGFCSCRAKIGVETRDEISDPRPIDTEIAGESHRKDVKIKPRCGEDLWDSVLADQILTLGWVSIGIVTGKATKKRRSTYINIVIMDGRI